MLEVARRLFKDAILESQRKCTYQNKDILNYQKISP